MKIKKRGKNLIINSLFIILVISSVILMLNTSNKITGMQVLDTTTAKLKLETTLSGLSFAQKVNQGSICVAITDPQQPMSFEAVKTGTGWTITQMDNMFCNGLNSEDFTILFPSYDAYSSVIDNPSPRNLINGAITQKFQILPSRYVEPGGNVICDATFKVKYCDALNQLASPDELIDGDLVCCLDKLTRSQRKKLEEHLAETGNKDEIGILEQPSSGFSMTSLFILIVVLVVIGGGTAGYFLFEKKRPVTGTKATTEGGEKRKPLSAAVQMSGLAQTQTTQQQQTTAEQTQLSPEDEQFRQLKEYAYQTMLQGYQPEELLEHFQEQGWDEERARQAINEAIERINQETQSAAQYTGYPPQA